MICFCPIVLSFAKYFVFSPQVSNSVYVADELEIMWISNNLSAVFVFVHILSIDLGLVKKSCYYDNNMMWFVVWACLGHTFLSNYAPLILNIPRVYTTCSHVGNNFRRSRKILPPLKLFFSKHIIIYFGSNIRIDWKPWQQSWVFFFQKFTKS